MESESRGGKKRRPKTKSDEDKTRRDETRRDEGETRQMKKDTQHTTYVSLPTKTKRNLCLLSCVLYVIIGYFIRIFTPLSIHLTVMFLIFQPKTGTTSP